MHGFKGFYFVAPLDDDAAIKHRYMTLVYYPLIIIDIKLGSGRHPATPPLNSISR
jgi:hypothetical protein